MLYPGNVESTGGRERYPVVLPVAVRMEAVSEEG